MSRIHGRDTKPEIIENRNSEKNGDSVNSIELKNCIALGEGQTTEFKRALSEDFSREISAFANSLGGTLLIGVDDKGTIVGVEHINKAKAHIQNTARSLEPPVKVTVEAVDRVLVVTVPKSADSPHSSGGRFYLREGATCQQMNRTQIRDYFFHERILLFDTMINQEFDLKKDLIKKRYLEFAAIAGIPKNIDMLDALQNIKLLADKKMTNAGSLILGKHGSRFIISSTIMCALFQGTTKTKILDQKLFDDDLVSNYNNALLYLKSHLNTEYIITSVRTNKLELPEEALREMLINAIAHRDYRNPKNIQIYIFYDRIEIHNPGGLVAGLKAADLGRRSVPRNPLLFGILYRMDLVENVGSGLKRIKDTVKEYGLESPKIEADDHWFTVTIPRKTQGKGLEKGLEKKAQKTKEIVLKILADKPNTTIAELAHELDIGDRRIRRHLTDLKTQGLLTRIGPDKGGYWKVIHNS